MGFEIIGTGSYAPEKILTNADLEAIVETSDEWITTRTGIKERHIASEEEATSDIALQAALKALETADISPDKLDLIIVATITQDKYFPSTACLLQKKLQADNATCFDLHAACSGLLYSMEVADSLIQARNNYKHVLIVGAEKLSSIVDWEDRATCVLFGDGAGALLLKQTTNGSNALITSNLGSAGKYADILEVPAGGSALPPSHDTIDQRLHFMKMEGQDVFKQAVNAMVKSCKQAIEEAGITPEDIKWLVPHQANLRILKAVGSRLGISTDNVFINVDKYGNTSAASIGIALDEIARSNSVEKGDYILLTAFGGGLTWGSALLKW